MTTLSSTRKLSHPFPSSPLFSYHVPYYTALHCIDSTGRPEWYRDYDSSATGSNPSQLLARSTSSQHSGGPALDEKLHHGPTAGLPTTDGRRRRTQQQLIVVVQFSPFPSRHVGGGYPGVHAGPGESREDQGDHGIISIDL